MTGPEHYAEGERLLALAMESPVVRPSDAVNLAAARTHFAAAQVVATLVGSESGYSLYRIEQWEPALGPASPPPDPDNPWSSPPVSS